MITLCLSLFGCSKDTNTISLRQESDHFNFYSTKTDEEALGDLEQPYAIAGGFVDFIINYYGYDIIIKLIEKPNEIEEILGLTKEDIIAKWSNYILSNY